MRENNLRNWKIICNFAAKSKREAEAKTEPRAGAEAMADWLLRSDELNVKAFGSVCLIRA